MVDGQVCHISAAGCVFLLISGPGVAHLKALTNRISEDLAKVSWLCYDSDEMCTKNGPLTFG